MLVGITGPDDFSIEMRNPFLFNFIEYMESIFESENVSEAISNSMITYSTELFRHDNTKQVNAPNIIFCSREFTETRCFICLEPFEMFDVVYDIPCNHPFHSSCLQKAVQFSHISCPLCRSIIPTTMTNDP